MSIIEEMVCFVETFKAPSSAWRSRDTRVQQGKRVSRLLNLGDSEVNVLTRSTGLWAPTVFVRFWNEGHVCATPAPAETLQV